MNPGMKMMMMARANEKRNKESGGGENREERGMENRDGRRMENRDGRRMENNRNEREMENRFRDRRGRERYDNGRFAPRNGYDMRNNYRGENEGGTQNNYGGYDNYEMEDNYEAENRRGRRRARSEYDEEMDDGWYPPPVYDRTNQIGFSGQGESGGGEMKRSNFPKMGRVPFGKEMAEEWMENIQNEDGTKGPHWSLQQVKQVMQQRGVESDPYKLWAAMNAEYSDRCAVNKKYGVSSVDFYLDSAIAFWLKDHDAVDDKLSVYYMDVVKH